MPEISDIQLSIQVKDKLVYEEGELKAGTPVKVIVSWSYDDEVLGGPFSGKAEISIPVNKASV